MNANHDISAANIFVRCSYLASFAARLASFGRYQTYMKAICEPVRDISHQQLGINMMEILKPTPFIIKKICMNCKMRKLYG